MREISQPGTLDFCHTLVLPDIFNQRWSRKHKARGQGQGHKKKSEAKAEDRHSRGQGQECSRARTTDTSASALQKKKKKGLHKNFSGNLHKKNVFQKIFQALHKILTIQNFNNFNVLEDSGPPLIRTNERFILFLLLTSIIIKTHHVKYSNRQQGCCEVTGLGSSSQAVTLKEKVSIIQ